ncbi:hypothetical protein BH23GEM5_BH23GEM5_19260 [soil metagenome]
MDGITLHQIAQWHNMLSARVPPTSMEAMHTNMTADGWFHAGVFVLTLAGVLLLYSAARQGATLPPMRWFLERNNSATSATISTPAARGDGCWEGRLG